MISDTEPSDNNISVPGPTRAKAKNIRRLDGKIRHVLWDLDLTFDEATRFESLSPADKILFQQRALDRLLNVIELFNRHCSHDLKYGLRELDAYEVELEKEDREGQA